MSPSDHESRSRAAGILLPFLILLAVHLLSGLPREQPLLLADELGYLGHARFLAGAAALPDMKTTQFYHFGAGLLQVPAFWVFDEPVAAYRAVLWIHSLLAALLLFPLRAILIRFFEVPDRVATWLAFACCLYPPLVMHSSLAWSEITYIAGYLVSALCFGRLLASRSATDALLFGLVVGCLYTIHPRALPVVVGSLALLVVLAVLRAIPLRRLLPGAAAMVAVVAATRVANAHLRSIAWAGGGEISATKLAERLIPDSDLPALAERAAGQLLYLGLATHGLALIGLFALVAAVAGGLRGGRRPGKLRDLLTTPATGLPIYVLLTAAGVFAGSCTLKLYSPHGPAGLRGADFIYGRYNEAFGLLAAAIGLAYLYQARRRGTQLRPWLLRTAVIAVVMVALALVVDARIDAALGRQLPDAADFGTTVVPPTRVDATAVPGVHPLVVLSDGLRLRRIALFSVLALLGISLAMYRSWPTGVALTALLFILFSLHNHLAYLKPLEERAQPRLEAARRMLALGEVEAVSYDTSRRRTDTLWGLQFLLQDAEFQRFNSQLGQRPGSEVVLAGDDWPRAEELGARFAIADGRGRALWLLPGELQGRLPAVEFEGVTFGGERQLDVQESGFYAQESSSGVPARWTAGRAMLRLPLDPSAPPPRSLEIEALAPGHPAARLRLLANGVELLNEAIPPEPRSWTLSMEPVPVDAELLLELESTTYRPADTVEGSQDRRQLGVLLKGLRLTR